MKKIDEILERSIQYNPQQRFSELKPFLIELLMHNCETVLEIGSAEGGLTYIFSELFTRVVALDIQHTANYEKYNITRFTVDSHNPGPYFEKIEKLGPYDLIFIDGEHTYEGVERDFNIYAPLLAFDGIIALHDIKDTAVQKQDKCFVHKFAKELTKANLHLFTKTFNEFTDEWGGRIIPERRDHGGIQMWIYL